MKKYICMKVGEAVKCLKKAKINSPFFKELKTLKKDNWLVEVLHTTDKITSFVIIKNTKKNRNWLKSIR